MEVLSKVIHQISISSVNVDRAEEEESELLPTPVKSPKDFIVDPEVKFETPEHLIRDIHSIVNGWWGWDLRHFSSNCPKYLKLLRETFILDESLSHILDYDLPYESQIERCSHFKLHLRDFHLYSSKIHSLVVYTNGNVEHKIKVENLTNGSELKPFLFYHEPVQGYPTFYIELWKHGLRGVYMKSKISFDIYENNGDKKFVTEWDKEVGSVTVDLQHINNNERPINIRIPEIFLNYFVSALKGALDNDSMELRDLRDTLLTVPKYTINVSYSGSDNSSQYQMHLSYNEREMMPNCRGVYRVEMEDLLNDKLKILIETKWGTDIYTETVDINQRLFLTQTTTASLKAKIEQSEFRWTITFEPLHPPDVVPTIRFLLLKMYEMELKEYMSEVKSILEWQDSSLKDEFENLIRFLYVYDEKHEKFHHLKKEALIILHSKYHFNNQVLTKYLPFDADQVEDYLSYATYQLAKFTVLGMDALPYSQIQAIWENVNSMTTIDEEFLSNIRRETLELMEANFRLNSLMKQKELLDSHFVTILNTIVSAFGKFGPDWGDLVATMYLDHAIPCLKHILTSKTCCGILTYNVYIRTKKIVSLSSSYDDDCLLMFEDCLDSWVRVSLDKAKTQVSKVLEFERAKYVLKKKDFEKMEWNEGALNMNGIFHTCKIFWEDLNWPVPQKHLEFGAKLLEGIHDIYVSYINGFHDILVQDDNAFDVRELVLILNSINLSISHLFEFMTILNGLIDKLCSTTNDSNCLEMISNFASALADAQERTNTRSEQMLEHFCEGETRIIRGFVEKHKLHHETDEATSLGELNKTLKYFYYNLNTSNASNDERLMVDLKKRLIQIHDDEVKALYDKLKTLYTKKGRDPKVYKSLSDAIPYLISLRRNLSLPDNPDILEIQRSLYPQSLPSKSICSKHLQAISEESLDEVHGTLRLKFIFEASNNVLKLNFRSLSSVVHREGKDDCHPSVTVSVFPFSIDDNVITPVYTNATEILFDLVTLSDSKKKFPYLFEMKVKPLEDAIEQFVVFQLFDHSYHFPQKWFRGWALVPWKDVQKSKGSSSVVWEDVEEVELSLATFNSRQDSKEFKELCQRKDSFAKDYEDIIESYSSGETIYYIPFGHKYEWINIHSTED